MNRIFKFILFFLLAPAFAIVAQTAGVVKEDFRVVDAGFSAESVVVGNLDGGVYNYDFSGSLLQQRRSLDGQAADNDGLNEIGELETIVAEWPAFSVLSELFAAKGVPQVVRNNLTGNQWDDYVAATKLKNLDEAGRLGRQERLPTPDITGRNYVKPDYTIWNSRGTVSAYGDAKVLQNGVVKFDAQSRGLVEWATTSESKKLIYYVPWQTQANAKLLNYASQRGVSIQFVIVK